MNTSINDLDSVIKRLEANYNECKISESEGILNINLPIGKIQVKQNRIFFFALNQPFGELEFENSEELYQEIEAFILTLQNEEDKCNPTFNKAEENAQKRCKHATLISGAIFPIAFVAYYLFDLSWIFLTAAMLIPAADLIYLRFIRLYSFRKDWICPYCNAKLPIKSKEWFPSLKSASYCPECGKLLIDKKLVKKLKEEVFSEKDHKPDYTFVPPKKRSRKTCIICGTLVLILTLLLLFSLIVLAEEAALLNTIINALVLVMTAALGFLLFFCPSYKPEEEKEKPLFIVCEQAFLPVPGIILCLLGAFFIFVSLAASSDGLLLTVFFDLIGLFLFITGVWMILAHKNRCLYIYKSQLIYITSFGRKREFHSSQIDNVMFTASDSIKFLDKNGKKLFSIEGNMIGSDNIFDWIEEQEINFTTSKSLEKRVAKQESGSNIIIWEEKYRTPLHSHLKAIRIGLVLTFILFATGCIAPIWLYLFTDLKISHAIYMTAFAPVPLLLHYLAFAPVLLLADKPKTATEEWKSMYIKFPTGAVILFSLFPLVQIYYFWEAHIMQIADTGKFVLLFIVFASIVLTVFYIRTPRHMRKNDDFFIMLLSVAALSFSMFYGIILLISSPAEHYPAVVVERSESDSDEEHTLTILLDDGTEAELNVSEQAYYLEKTGTKFVVCQKNNVFGIRIVRLHLPENNSSQTDNTST